MTHTHTPGPFPLHIQHDGERYAIITAQGNHFATTHDPSAARLIAAAPELLEIAQWVVDELPGVIRAHCPLGVPKAVAAVHDNARAAIAKAEGREA